MRRNFLKILLVPVLFFCVICVRGQYDAISNRLNTWYLEERFLIADRNDDALLSKSELLRFADEFSFYLVDHHFITTDENRDGQLSFNEIINRVKSEMAYRKSMDNKELNQLARSYPNLLHADLTFMKQNPRLVEALFSNLIWMYDHKQLVDQLLSDGNWIESHPEVLLALQRNLRWMVANPIDAEKIYRNRNTTQQLPELLGWRADHRNFIRNNRLIDKFYELNLFLD